MKILENISDDFNARFAGILLEAKKGKKKWNPNPWAVCHTTVDKKDEPEKFEKCVMDVKKKQASGGSEDGTQKTAGSEAESHPLDETKKIASAGPEINAGNYSQKVRSALADIIMDENGVAKKSSGSGDASAGEADAICGSDDATEVIRCFSSRGFRPRYCAEYIFSASKTAEPETKNGEGKDA